MKPFKIMPCDDIDLISNKIYQYLLEKTDLLTNISVGWHFLDKHDFFKEVPELINFFLKQKLIPNSASVVILTETGQLALHVDELPVVVKINFPVKNTKGWANRWFSVNEQELKNCPKTINQFGSQIEDLKSIPEDHFTLLDQIMDLDQPILFNSRIPHDVIKLNGESPRIIASFTFVNEPLDLLK